jgi:DNA-binding NarL/FixJ family response regulator
MMAIQVFIADDHAMVREGLRMILEAQPNIRVIGEAANGHEAVRSAARRCPDVLVMDVLMPGLNGIEATYQIRAVCPATRIVMLSMVADEEHVARALQAGAIGYILKGASGAEVINAIQAAYIGRSYFSQQLAHIEAKREQILAASPLQKLSEREREMLQLIAEGRTSAEISQVFKLSPKTIETYRSRLMRKLGVSTIPGLVKFAIKYGLTSLDDIT